MHLTSSELSSSALSLQFEVAFQAIRCYELFIRWITLIHSYLAGVQISPIFLFWKCFCSRLCMFKIFFIFFLSFSVFAGPRSAPFPIWLNEDYTWQRAQMMHLQTQQQLQAQDQYRRLLLLQDQQRQIQRLQDQQNQLEFMQRNSIMHQHIDRLKVYSRPALSKPQALPHSKEKRKNK